MRVFVLAPIAGERKKERKGNGGGIEACPASPQMMILWMA